MNIVQALKDLEEKTLKTYEAIISLQCGDLDSIPARFNIKVLQKVKELQAMADNIEYKISDSYVESH